MTPRSSTLGLKKLLRFLHCRAALISLSSSAAGVLCALSFPVYSIGHTRSLAIGDGKACLLRTSSRDRGHCQPVSGNGLWFQAERIVNRVGYFDPEVRKPFHRPSSRV